MSILYTLALKSIKYLHSNEIIKHAVYLGTFNSNRVLHEYNVYQLHLLCVVRDPTTILPGGNASQNTCMHAMIAITDDTTYVCTLVPMV